MAALKFILTGHEGTKKLLPATAFLANKYLPHGADIRFLNFGPAPAKLQEMIKGGLLLDSSYIALDAEQKGGAHAWAAYLRMYMGSMKDEFIVFALDDYLLSAPLNWEKLSLMLGRMEKDKSIVSGRLCQSQCFHPSQYEEDAEGVLTMKPISYTATTQYCIWRREFLIDLLGKVSTPWNFELVGSVYLNEAGKKTIGTIVPAMQYNDHSALSSQWAGVDMKGVLAEDKELIFKMGLLELGDLC